MCNIYGSPHTGGEHGYQEVPNAWVLLAAILEAVGISHLHLAILDTEGRAGGRQKRPTGKPRPQGL